MSTALLPRKSLYRCSINAFPQWESDTSLRHQNQLEVYGRCRSSRVSSCGRLPVPKEIVFMTVFDVNHDIVLKHIMDQYYPSAPVVIGILTSRKNPTRKRNDGFDKYSSKKTSNIICKGLLNACLPPFIFENNHAQMLQPRRHNPTWESFCICIRR